MRKIFFSFLSLLFWVSYPTYANETYILDPSHTYVEWKVKHFGYSTISGKWLAEGKVNVDPAQSKINTISVVIQMNKLVTGIPKLDTHLSNSDFFDVEKYPEATFESLTTEVKGKRAMIKGKLTLHGITKPITLQAKINKIDVHPMTHKKTIGFSADTQLQRSAFDVGKYAPSVSDDVTIHIEGEASLES